MRYLQQGRMLVRPTISRPREVEMRQQYQRARYWAIKRARAYPGVVATALREYGRISYWYDAGRLQLLCGTRTHHPMDEPAHHNEPDGEEPAPIVPHCRIPGQIGGSRRKPNRPPPPL